MKDSGIILEEATRSSERIGRENLTGKDKTAKNQTKLYSHFITNVSHRNLSVTFWSGLLTMCNALGLLRKQHS